MGEGSARTGIDWYWGEPGTWGTEESEWRQAQIGMLGKVCWVSLMSGAKRKANDHSRNFCLRMFGPALGHKKPQQWVPFPPSRSPGSAGGGGVGGG